MFIKEVCVENFTVIPQAIEKGAKRIELCDNLAVGGTTVSHGVLVETLKYCQEKQIPVMSIIRPRGGNFVYHDIELKMMEADLYEVKKYGADGVVIGCLTDDGWLDEDALERLIDIANGMQITFHMAFDEIPADKQFAAIDWLAENGVHRILTHGGPMNKTIEENLPRLKKLVDYAKERIIILPGGGINIENYQQVVDTLGVNEVHGTKIVGLLN